MGVEEAILDILVSCGGTFSFVEDSTLPAGRQSVDLDVQPLVEEGLRREREMQRILNLYPDDRVTFRSADNPSDKISLTPEEFKLAEQFADEWDQIAFDPDYDTLPLSHFEPLVRKIFGSAKLI